MSSLSRELVFLILQFLDEEKFKETVHKLEQESGFYFNMRYFEEAVVAGEWDDVEKYLSGFTKVDDNRYSMKIFFEIRKQKYLEALDRQDRAKAVEILVKDLKVFASFNDELYKEITSLLTLDNFRDNEQLSKYGDTKSARNIMLLELRKLIEANPLFRDKLSFPALKLSRLRTLINQSLNWQHQLCKNPRPNPDIKTLFVDHSCGPLASNGMPRVPLVSSANANANSVGPKPPGTTFQLGAHAAFQPSTASAGPTVGLASWMGSNAPTPIPPQATPPAPATGKRPRSPIALPDAYEEGIKRLKDFHEVREPQPAAAPPAPPTLPPPNLDDLPRTVVRTLHQGATVTTMDFHPFQHSTLLVGTNSGDVAVWDLRPSEKKVEMRFKSQIVHDTNIAINRAVWSPEGRLIGAAFSKRVVHCFSYNPTLMEVALHLEIDAHNGGVNDIAFASPKQLCVITCGDDHTIKIWDASSGRKQYTFEGHEAPVYSVCPHHKENIQFIFSTAIDGRIKAWLYDDRGSRVDYVAPGNWCTTMAYSQDGNRLFSCGTSKDGETSLVEWNESEGAIRRAYKGFRRGPHNMQGVHQVVQFDTTKNRFLAAGDDGYIKFWDMDNTELLTQIDADAGLPVSPRVRFNKLGNLLAVNADNNCFKVLATKDGMALLRDFDVRKSATPQLGPKTEPTASTPVPLKPTPPVQTPPASEPSPPPTTLAARSRDDEVVASMIAERKISNLVPPTVATPKLLEFSEPSEVRSIRCPDSLAPTKIARLLYTNAGNSILALTATAVHKVWKWTRGNVDRKMDPSTAWVLWQPSNGNMMTNDTGPDSRPESVSHCIALSKNDSYVMSASGGRVSLYNLLTFKVMTMFMPPPPAATVLTFHPDNNNIIAIGMDDASVQIYNVRNDEVETKLTGHSKAITGLAFLSVSKLLVSAGADADLCAWNISSWTKRRSKVLPMVTGGETRAQAHAELSQVLVTHESMLGIYDADGLDLVARWSPKDAEHFSDPISAAAYSCDSAFVFAGFTNGAVAVFDGSTLTPVTRIALSVYSLRPVYPVVIASHPQKANQFALGSSDGSVYVLEPLEGVPDWTKKEVEELEGKAAIAQVEQGEQPRKHEVT